MNSSLVHQILRKRIYMGEFDFNGTTYQGTHEPLMTRERWGRVQEYLDARAETKDEESEARFRFLGACALRPLRLPDRRRDQKGALRLLPLHWEPRKVSRALHTGRFVEGKVRASLRSW